MTLRESPVEELSRRVGEIGMPYSGIHIRHTDLKSRYARLLARMKAFNPRKLFLATDSKAVLEDFRAALGQHRLFPSPPFLR